MTPLFCRKTIKKRGAVFLEKSKNLNLSTKRGVGGTLIRNWKKWSDKVLKYFFSIYPENFIKIRLSGKKLTTRVASPTILFTQQLLPLRGISIHMVASRRVRTEMALRGRAIFSRRIPSRHTHTQT